MFKEIKKSKLTRLLNDTNEWITFHHTYKVTVGEIEKAIPEGYELAGVHFHPPTGNPYWATATEFAVLRCDTLGTISKGTLYLNVDRMITQLFCDTELAPGYCCIIVRVKQPKPSYSKKYLLVAHAKPISVKWEDIYPNTSMDQLMNAVNNFGVELVRFDWVELGNKYLPHDLKTVQTWSRRRPNSDGLRFMRWIVK